MRRQMQQPKRAGRCDSRSSCPDTPAGASPYPDLEENWGDEDRAWGWTLVPGNSIPDLRPVVQPTSHRLVAGAHRPLLTLGK
jgi:hypothetical protein